MSQKKKGCKCWQCDKIVPTKYQCKNCYFWFCPECLKGSVDVCLACKIDKEIEERGYVVRTKSA